MTESNADAREAEFLDLLAAVVDAVPVERLASILLDAKTRCQADE